MKQLTGFISCVGKADKRLHSRVSPVLPVQGMLDFLREFALWPLSSCRAFSHLFLSSFSSLSSTLSLPQGDQRPQRKHLQALWSSICWSLAFGRTIPIGGERPGTSPGFASPGCGLCPQLLTCPAQPQCPPPVPGEPCPCPESPWLVSVCCPVCHCPARARYLIHVRRLRTR